MSPRLGDSSLASRLGTISVTNITNPLIWVAVALLVAVLILAPIESARPFAIMLGVLLCFDVAVFLATFVYFGIKDPDRLQSETHRYQMANLTLRQQGKVKARVIEAEPVVPNPALPPAADSQLAPPVGAEQVEVIDEGNPVLASEVVPK